jgi:hypothetical protein
MQTGKKSAILPQEFQKLGLIREALKPPAWLSKLKPTDARAEIHAFSETKAARAAIEAKKAEAYCHARTIMNAPR